MLSDRMEEAPGCECVHAEAAPSCFETQSGTESGRQEGRALRADTLQHAVAVVHMRSPEVMSKSLTSVVAVGNKSNYLHELEGEPGFGVGAGVGAETEYEIEAHAEVVDDGPGIDYSIEDHIRAAIGLESLQAQEEACPEART